uniref:FCP1 homology domain-containing protein n=2 Tax=Kalanchoe fedtschenkoi TaxID=63787 RepID=A0A7N0VCW7_KALFE
MATSEDVANLGSVPEGKKSRKNRKRRKMKQALCVPLDGTISKQNLEAGHKTFLSYDQNNQNEHNKGNQALEESEMHDSIREGALFKRVCTQFDDIIASEDKNIEQDTLNDRPKGGKKRKLDIENNISGSGQGGLSSESCPLNNSNHHRGTEILTSGNAVTTTLKQEMLGTSSPVSVNDNLNMIAGGITTPISVNSCVKMDTIENIGDPLVNPHVNQIYDIGGTKSSEPRQVDQKMEDVVLPQTSEGISAVDVNVNGRQDENLEAATEGTLVENVNCLNEQPRSASDKDLIMLEKLKENEYCAKNVGGLFDVGTDQDIQYLKSHTRKKRRKKKKSANSHLIAYGAGDGQIAETSSIRDADNTLSAEGIMPIGAENVHVEIVRYSDDKTVLDIKENDDFDDNVVTSSEVAVGDRTQDPKICMKKKRKKNKNKNKMSSMSQLELEEGGAMTRPSSANDMTLIQSNERNFAATGKGITVSHNHLDKMSESNHCVKEVNVHKITESARSCEDQQTPMEVLKNESISTLDPSELVAREPNAEKSCKLSNVNVEDFQVDQSLACMHSGFAGQATPSVKDSSKISTASEDICDRNLTTVQEDIIDIPCVSTTKTQNASLLNTEATLLEHKKSVQLSSSDSAEDICRIISVSEAVHESVLHLSPERNCTGCPRRKLLILDLNGLLADIVAHVRSGYKPDIMVSQKAVFTRPFCESFLQFCFERFDVAVWSSRVKKNVDKVLDFLMGGLKKKLVFYWDRSHCTITRFPTVENSDKPLVLKELKKIWEKHQSHIAWEKEKYNQSNTLLLDDSPYKALRNPADTAIFPLSYQHTDVNDCSLGPGGDLRVYLEKLAMADSIPEYVRNHPFGQRPIRDTNLSWKYYKKVLSALNQSDGL